MTLEKLKKDRKILKRIDMAVARQSFIVYFCQLLIYCLLLVSSDLVERIPRLVLVAGFCLLLLTGVRVLLMLKIQTLYARGPQRCRFGFLLFNGFQSLVWSVFVFTAVIQLGVEQQITWVMVLATVGMAVYHGIVWLPFNQANKIFHVITMIPLFFAFLLTDSDFALLVCVATIAVFFGLIHWSQKGYDFFWQNQETLEELKEANRRMEVANAKLVRLGEVRVDMMTDLSYEVRTPMNSVLGMLTLLAEMKLSDNQREIISVAQHAGQHLLSLVDDIMDFSKIASGSIALDSVVFNLRKCFDETLETIGPQAHAKGLELSCYFDENIPIRVRGDHNRITQVVSNLIGNAIKFSEQGEVVVAVSMVRLSSNEGLLRVQVSDQGTGISSEQQDQLFRAFHKADSSTERKQGGTGLGLAICKGLVEAMRGQIGLVSEEGKGSTFWFTAHLRLSTQQGQQSNQFSVFEGKRVLLYGMPEGMASSIVKLLKSWGVVAQVAPPDYDHTLQTLRQAAREKNSFDLCMLNFGFRYHGALKLSKIVKEDPSLMNCRQILLLSLEQRSEAEIKNYLEGYEDLVLMTKPIQSKVFYDILDNLFRINRKKKVTEYLPNKTLCKDKDYRILLVEDNKVNQMVEKGMLKRLGYTVSVVEDGVQAVDIFSEKPFDLVLMDCQMPHMNGYDATERIRSIEEARGLPRVPIIAMTAHVVDGEETRCFAAGMDDVMLKPIDLAELQTKLRRWLLNDGLQTGIVHTAAGEDPTSLGPAV